MSCLCPKDFIEKNGYGTYKNTVSMIPPWRPEKSATIDLCLATEIAWLWNQGVKTIESCCGHNNYANNNARGYIAVEDESIEKMIELGYEQHNHFSLKEDDPKRRNFYNPKTTA